jgi:hypothetical protein
MARVLLAVGLLAITSCKRPPPAHEPPPRDQRTREFLERMEAREYRKPYVELTPSILARIPDDELEEAIDVFADNKIGILGDETMLFERFERMASGLRALHATSVLDGEVRTGGFNQFFWYSSQRYAAAALEGYELFGLHALEQLLRRAIAIHEKDAERLAKLRRGDSIEGFNESYEDNPFRALDKEYPRAAQDLSRARIACIRQHPFLFSGQLHEDGALPSWPAGDERVIR